MLSNEGRKSERSCAYFGDIDELAGYDDRAVATLARELVWLKGKSIRVKCTEILD